MADDMRTIFGDMEGIAEPAGQRRRRAVHRLGVPGAAGVRVALVLDADRVLVDGPVAGVPGGVAIDHLLRDLPVAGADVVMGAGLRGRVLEPGDRARVAALHVVDDDGGDGVAGTAAGRVAGRGGDEGDAGAARAIFAGEVLLDLSPKRLACALELLRREADLLAFHRDGEPVAQHPVHLGGVGVGCPGVVHARHPHHRLPPVAQAALVEVVVLREEPFALCAQQRRAAAGVGESVGAQRFAGEPGEERGPGQRARFRRVGPIDQVQQAVPSVGRGRVHGEARVHPGEGDEQRRGHAFERRGALQLALQRGRRRFKGAGTGDAGERGKRQGEAHAATLALRLHPAPRTNDRGRRAQAQGVKRYRSARMTEATTVKWQTAAATTRAWKISW